MDKFMMFLFVASAIANVLLLFMLQEAYATETRLKKSLSQYAWREEDRQLLHNAVADELLQKKAELSRANDLLKNVSKNMLTENSPAKKAVDSYLISQGW